MLLDLDLHEMLDSERVWSHHNHLDSFSFAAGPQRIKLQMRSEPVATSTTKQTAVAQLHRIGSPLQRVRRFPSPSAGYSGGSAGALSLSVPAALRSQASVAMMEKRCVPCVEMIGSFLSFFLDGAKGPESSTEQRSL